MIHIEKLSPSTAGLVTYLNSDAIHHRAAEEYIVNFMTKKQFRHMSALYKLHMTLMYLFYNNVRLVTKIQRHHQIELQN